MIQSFPWHEDVKRSSHVFASLLLKVLGDITQCVTSNYLDEYLATLNILNTPISIKVEILVQSDTQHSCSECQEKPQPHILSLFCISLPHILTID